MRYLNASWTLSQSGTVANRLGRIYEKAGQSANGHVLGWLLGVFQSRGDLILENLALPATFNTNRVVGRKYTRDLLAFDSKKVTTRTYLVKLPIGFGVGQYGFLPPGAYASTNLASTGKIYSFRVIE